MRETFPQPGIGTRPEIPNSDFIGVINSLALSPEKKERLTKRVEELRSKNWTNLNIANELELLLGIKLVVYKERRKKPIPNTIH